MELSTAELTAMLDEIRAEVSDRTLAGFNHAIGRRIGEAAARIAERDNLSVVVSVFKGGQRVYHAAFEGTTPEHEDWVRRKVNTTLRHEVPSLEFLLRQKVSGRIPDWLDPLEFAVAGGGVPLVVDGLIAGVVAVSGMVGSIRDDHDLAMSAIRSAATSP